MPFHGLVPKKDNMGFILYILYNLLTPFLFIAAIFISFFSLRHKFSDNLNALKERISFSTKGFPQKAYWFHASSIGEVKAIKSIIEKAKELKPDIPFIITVSTLSGKKEALSLTPYVRILPADFYFLIKRFIKNLKPLKLFVAETEIWPNLLIHASKECKVKILNARISDKTFASYLKISPLIRFSLKNISRICAQSKKDADRYSRFFDKEKIFIAGNIKYDSLKKDEKAVDLAENIIKSADIQNKNKIIFGSTHPKEEEIIADSFEILKNEGEDVFFIIVPRHINKAILTKEIFDKKQIKTKLLSEKSKEKTEVLIADENGILFPLYSQGEICFVGGTLDDTGGHNLLEPCVYAKPVIFGPNFSNAAEAGEKLIENKGGFIVKDAYDMAARIRVLLKDKDFLKKTGENSLKTLDSLKGASAKTILEIID